jgi:hypothetical protein
MLYKLYPVNYQLVKNKSKITNADIRNFIPTEEDIDYKFNKFYKWNKDKLQPCSFVVDKPSLYNTSNSECLKIYATSKDKHNLEITITDTVRVDKFDDKSKMFNRF